MESYLVVQKCRASRNRRGQADEHLSQRLMPQFRCVWKALHPDKVTDSQPVPTDNCFQNKLPKKDGSFRMYWCRWEM